ncbi:MAG: hypothetical protein RMY16_25780 [Nostoc sp. DedQUE12b]|uniref:hypothetical protein n=1 Tax=Nostoc sp. DedQUE12b TaxID=3075398 RepID=UPI002AD1F53F|nr:hypothetical protein [Nostoc sp. DedQUE12b]MDZ8088929.1 hypothetical protein [Nostoc sp. DedQUE12b]
MSEPRYGIWAPVRGNFVPLHAPDEPIDASDASYERTRSLIYFPSVIRLQVDQFPILLG